MNENEKNEKFFGRGNPAMDLEVVKTKGSYIYSANAREYVDFLGGAGVGSLGWGVPEIEDAIRKKDRPSYVYPNFHYKPWNELAERLAELAPGKLKKSFRVTGGSEAVDGALEMAMMATQREKIVSIAGAYHGNTFAALTASAKSKSDGIPNIMDGFHKVAPPLNKSKLHEVESLLKSKEVAAVIMEPIIINLGVLIPEEEFMIGLDKLCKKYGSLLIMDEAITGFGRTGKMFASEHFDIEPDILCMAKAITAGHAGMGAIIVTEEVASKVEGKVGLYSSYGWHPVSVDAALATLDYLQAHREKIFSNIEHLSELFRKEISEVDFKRDVEIRIKGAAIGIDLKDEEIASEVKQKALEKGLLINTEGSSLLFLPNFLMEEETVKKGMKILRQCL